VTATLLGSHRRHAFSDRHPARQSSPACIQWPPPCWQSSPACIQWPPPCPAVIAGMHSVTATLLGGHRRHAFGDRHPARRSSPACQRSSP